MTSSSPDRSVVDRFVYTEKVGGSKPSRDTKYIRDTGDTMCHSMKDFCHGG